MAKTFVNYRKYIGKARVCCGLVGARKHPKPSANHRESPGKVLGLTGSWMPVNATPPLETTGDAQES